MERKPRKAMPSRKKAIEDMCKSCIYDGSNGSGTWREQCANCPSKNCPLYPLRPLPAGKTYEDYE